MIFCNMNSNWSNFLDMTLQEQVKKAFLSTITYYELTQFEQIVLGISKVFLNH